MCVFVCMHMYIDPFTVKIASWVIRTSYNILWSNLHKRLHKIPVKINFSLSGMCDHRKVSSLPCV